MSYHLSLLSNTARSKKKGESGFPNPPISSTTADADALGRSSASASGCADRGSS